MTFFGKSIMLTKPANLSHMVNLFFCLYRKESFHGKLIRMIDNAKII